MRPTALKAIILTPLIVFYELHSISIHILVSFQHPPDGPAGLPLQLLYPLRHRPQLVSQLKLPELQGIDKVERRSCLLLYELQILLLLIQTKHHLTFFPSDFHQDFQPLVKSDLEAGIVKLTEVLKDCSQVEIRQELSRQRGSIVVSSKDVCRGKVDDT